MSNSKLTASVIVLIKGQDHHEKVNPVVVESLKYNLCMMMSTMARYLHDMGVPREQHPDELVVLVHDGQPDNISWDRTVVPNSLDPKSYKHPGVMPYAALETIAQIELDGETAYQDLSKAIALARQSLGWKVAA